MKQMFQRLMGLQLVRNRKGTYPFPWFRVDLLMNSIVDSLLPLGVGPIFLVELAKADWNHYSHRSWIQELAAIQVNCIDGLWRPLWNECI